MRYIAYGLIPLAIAGAAGTAAADAVTWNGDVVEGNSWQTSFVAFSFSAADFIGVRITSVQGAFEGPTFLNFSKAGWDNHADYGEFPTIAAASGPAFSSMGFTLHFAGDAPDPLSYDMVFFSGQAISSVFHFQWDGTSFNISQGGPAYDLDREDFETVGSPVMPLPSAAAMIGVGLVALGVGRRRPG